VDAGDVATFGAAFLGVASIIALVTFYVSFGLDRPTGRRTRVAAMLLLAVTGVGYSIEWLFEATAGSHARVYCWAGLRSLLAVVMLNFALGLWRDGQRTPRDDPPAPPPFN
jgi:hypothetical protein